MIMQPLVDVEAMTAPTRERTCFKGHMKTTLTIRIPLEIVDNSPQRLTQTLITMIGRLLSGAQTMGLDTTPFEVTLPRELHRRLAHTAYNTSRAESVLQMIEHHAGTTPGQIKADSSIIAVTANEVRVDDVLIDSAGEWPVLKVCTNYAARGYPQTTVTIDTGRKDDHPANQTISLVAHNVVVVRRK